MSALLFDRIYKLSAAGTSLLCQGLDGDKHGKYEIDFQFRQFNRTGGDIRCWPNSDSTNLTSYFANNLGAPSQVTTWRIGATTTHTDYAVSQGRLQIFGRRTIEGEATYIGFDCRSSDSTQSTGNNGVRSSGGIYLDRSANLTEILFDFTQTFDIGSWVRIRQALPDLALA